MRRLAGWTCILGLLAGAQTLSAGEAGGERIIELKWISLFDAPSFAPTASPSVQFVPLGRDGTGAISFANTAGKLSLRAADDKVRLDTDGNGSVDDADAPAVGNGEIARISFPFGDRTVEYPFRVQIVETRYVLLFGGLALQGEIDGRTIRLLDGGLDGRFGVAGKDMLSIAPSGVQAGNPLSMGGGATTRWAVTRPWAGRSTRSSCWRRGRSSGAGLMRARRRR